MGFDVNQLYKFILSLVDKIAPLFVNLFGSIGKGH